MSMLPCENCRPFRGATGKMTQGHCRCRLCGAHFGALTERELEEMDVLIEHSDVAHDLWPIGVAMPRPSVTRRLIDEVRARRLMSRDVYIVQEKNSTRGVTPESILEEIKEKNE